MKKIRFEEAWEDYLHWQTQDRKNRIVFRIEGNLLEIVQCGSHYRDK